MTDWGRDRVLFQPVFTAKNCWSLTRGTTPGFRKRFYTEPFKQVLLAGNFTELKTSPTA